MNLMNFRNKATALALLLVASLVGAPAFAATGDVGDVVTTAITGTNPQIVSVIGAMAAALVLILAWGLIRKAFGGK